MEETIEVMLDTIFDEEAYPIYRETCKGLGLPDDDYVAQGFHGEELVALETERFKRWLHAVVELIRSDAK